MAKMKVIAQKNDAGRLNWIEIYKRRKPLRMDFVWDAKGLTREIEFSGRRQDMPSISDVMLMFNEGFIERIGVVKLINLIEKIELIEKISLVDLITKISEVTTIKKIEHIETIGKDNLFIDLLKQGAVSERRSTIENNGVTPSWDSNTGDARRGKFFTRGCLGFIERIQVYCRDTGVSGGTITVYISPNPSLGYVASANVTVPASGEPAWRNATFNRMWLYDKLFIFVACSNGNIKHGYDDEVPLKRDSFMSANAGASWTVDEVRRWFRVIMKGQTVGDIVPSTINTVEIPSVAGARQFKELEVPANSELYDTLQVGAGELLIAIFYTDTSLARDVLKPRIECDGVQVMPSDDSMGTWHDYLVGTEGIGIKCAVWDIEKNYYSMIVLLPFPFKRSIKVGFFNVDVVTARSGYVSYSYKKIS